jgi:hypothetical protein
MGRPGRGSDQFPLRLPAGLRDRIKAYAAKHGRSMNAEILRVLEREYPEPWPVEERVESLLEMMHILRGGATDERIMQLSERLKETVVGMVSGRIKGLDEDVLSRVAQRVQDWEIRQAELELSGLDLDEDEHRSLERSGRTDKFVDR